VYVDQTIQCMWTNKKQFLTIIKRKLKYTLTIYNWQDQTSTKQEDCRRNSHYNIYKIQ